MDLEDWELLPDNTSFLEFGLEDVKDVLSKEIVYMDYFREEPNLIHHQSSKIHDQEEEDNIQFKDIGVSHVFFKIKPMGDQEAVEVPQLKPPPAPLMVEFSEVVEIEESIGLQDEGEKQKRKLEKFSISFCGWRLTGVRAICSAGVTTAAAILIVIFGGVRQLKQQQQRRHHHHSHILQFQIHTKDKVVQQAGKLKQTPPAAPAMMRPANVSFGGCYDGLI